MLDEIEKIATDLLSLSKDEVRQMREALLVEVAQDDARYAARTALNHPEGSTTPLNDAADRSQQTYTKIRARMMKALPDLLALILAEQVARQKRDEAAEARNRHWEAEHERRAVGPHPETRDLFARLFKHGVTPWHLKALRDEDVAIIADLIRWKANDARYKNADTPWRSVLRLYANRLILQPDHGVTVKKSAPGTPVRGKRYTSPNYYMFNEMVEAHWSATPIPTDVAASDQDEDVRIIEPVDDETSEQPETPVPITNEPAAEDEAAALSRVELEPEPIQSAEVQIDRDRARSLAEAVYAADHRRMSIYWPSDIPEGEYDPSMLIPALERMLASSRSWKGAEDFLEAARLGKAREFIQTRRVSGIAYLAMRLETGEDAAFADARKYGVLP